MVNCLPKVCDDNLVYSHDFTGQIRLSSTIQTISNNYKNKQQCIY